MLKNQNPSLHVILFLLLTAGNAISQSPIFVDATTEAGIHFKHNKGTTEHKHIIETMGSGTVFFDYDTDGDPDLYSSTVVPFLKRTNIR